MASSSFAGSARRPDPTTVLPDVGSGVALAARAGYAAKGIVYVLVGGLTASAALGSGDTTTPSEVVRGLPGTWWGATMLVLIAIGLAGYVVWQIVRAIADPENRGTDAKGLALRASYLFSAAVYGLLGFTAVKVLLDRSSSSSGSSSSEQASGMLLSLPGGRWLVALLALIVIGRGCAELYNAWSERFRENLELQVGGGVASWMIRVGKAGLTARGIVFLLIGAFLVLAATSGSSSQARGLEGAMEALRDRGGPWLMAAVAVGLACYGAFQLIKARYRTIPD